MCRVEVSAVHVTTSADVAIVVIIILLLMGRAVSGVRIVGEECLGSGGPARAKRLPAESGLSDKRSSFGYASLAGISHQGGAAC